jgi:bile acid:Na+ symporter, BASS family
VSHSSAVGLGFAFAIAVSAWLFGRSARWSPFAFSLWVLSVVAVAISVPAVFRDWGALEPTRTIGPLIQIIMFGMGTTLSVEDFRQVLVEPKKIAIGMVLQFTVMPVTGWALAKAFGLPPELAAGVVLIGSCPGGVASNVITYLAKGNVALSVTMTACSTLMSPVMTPLGMKILAGRMVDVDFAKMLVEILQIVIVPVVLGLIANQLLKRLRLHGEWVERYLSGLAMIAICIVIGIIVAKSRDRLVAVGAVMFLVAVIHNAIGYLLGYAGAAWCGLNRSDCRTVSIEVGMQNGGLASALATNVLKSDDAAIAGAIFGPWMSIAGAVLASCWRKQDTMQALPEDSSS